MSEQDVETLRQGFLSLLGYAVMKDCFSTKDRVYLPASRLITECEMPNVSAEQSVLDAVHLISKPLQ